MSFGSRQEVVGRLRRRYERAGRVYRQRLIGQLCEVCGYERKYAIKVLNGNRSGPRGLARGGGQQRYAAPERVVLAQIWRWGDYPCGKRLVAMLPLWLSAYERRRGVLDEAVRQRLLGISAATADRLLAAERAHGRQRRGGTKPGGLLRTQIPVRCESWNVDRPGYLEADSVDHGGQSTAGSYVHSLTFTDIFSGWVEQDAVWNKGAAGVMRAIRQIEADVPFAILGFDSDNGAEFINHHLLRYFRCRAAPVDFTRSRAYRKNDNAHVEQKNWSKVRQLLGYERFDQYELVEIVHALYRGPWRLLQNFFQPVMKLTHKHRRGGRVHKRYDRAQTPAQRLLAWEGLRTDKRAWLLHLQATLDPVALTEAVDRQCQQLRRILREGRRHAA